MSSHAEPEVVCRWCGAEDSHYSEHCPEIRPGMPDLDDEDDGEEEEL